ncbi:MAG: hypothetical protein LBR58_02885 [Propionibacteriaceae bacterium]|jgi:hypothetical protein|nr:hypothetical protein [Propionibacteriaceae bacterium]
MAGKAVTYYLDEQVIQNVKDQAAQEGISASAYANRRLASSRRPWPETMLALLGSLGGEPLEEPEELPWEADLPRIQL